MGGVATRFYLGQGRARGDPAPRRARRLAHRAAEVDSGGQRPLVATVAGARQAQRRLATGELDAIAASEREADR